MNCHTCKWWEVPPGYDRSAAVSPRPNPPAVPDQYKCVYEAPKAQVIVAQGMAGPQPVPVTYWPTNEAGGRCHCFERAEIVPLLKAV